MVEKTYLLYLNTHTYAYKHTDILTYKSRYSYVFCLFFLLHFPTKDQVLSCFGLQTSLIHRGLVLPTPVCLAGAILGSLCPHVRSTFPVLLAAAYTSTNCDSMQFNAYITDSQPLRSRNQAMKFSFRYCNIEISCLLSGRKPPVR